MKRNKKHLQQVHDDKSPFTQSPLRELIGPYGTSNHITELLNGQYPIDELELPAHTKEWLRWLKQTDEEREVARTRPKISPDMFRGAFKVTNEKTSSSTSHLHYTL